MANPSFVPLGSRVVKAGGLMTSGKQRKIGMRVYNSSGSDIAIDKLVAVVGFDTTTGLPKVVLADANTATHLDVYVTLQAITSATEGHVFKGGLSAANLNTNSATTVGDPVYLSETAGGFVHTAPTTSDAAQIPAGWVTVKSATVGQIHWDIGQPIKYGSNAIQGAVLGPIANEVVAAANVITAAESGTTFFLNSGTEFASTLPAPAAGLKYTFIVTAAPSSASYTVVTEGGCQVLAGHVLTSGFADSGSDVELAATGTTITFVDGVSVVGDRAEVISDGTSWFASCIFAAEAGITITG